LAAELNAETILASWNVKFDFGWHRVSFYGDFMKDAMNLAILLKL